MPSLSIDVLRLSNFRLLLFTRMFVTMALQSQAVIVGWQVYSLTHDPFMLGLTGLTEALPAITCALFAGHVVDVSRPRTVYLCCLSAMALNMAMLLAFAGGYIPVPGGHVLPFIFTGVLISGIARSFTMPASFSLLPQIVPRSDISSASAWLNSGFQVSAIGGPAVAGLVYGGYGPHGAWFMPTALMSMALLMVSMLKPQFSPSAAKREPAVQSIIGGWKFILRNRLLLSIMALDMFAVLFGGAVAMLPAFADQILHVGSEGLGALRAAPAMGAIVTALTLALRPMRHVSTTRMLWAVTGFGLAMIGFGLSHAFWLSMLCLAFSGMCDSVSVVIRQTLMQYLTPDNMRGRVSSVSSMFVISSNEIGAFESGTAARLLGLEPSVVIGGIGTLAVVAFTLWFSPKMRGTVIDADSKAA